MRVGLFKTRHGPLFASRTGGYTGAIMKQLSITQAKRDLSRLVTQREPVAVTIRGKSIGLLRMYAEPVFDLVQSRAAFERLRALAAKRKPSKKHGATRAVRELRDRGE